MLKEYYKIIFYFSSELFTGCLSNYTLSRSCQHFATPLSQTQPLVWSSSCVLSIKIAPLHHWLKNPLHSACYNQNIWTSFFFVPCSFHPEFSASWTYYTFGQPLHLKLIWRPTCLKLTTASIIPSNLKINKFIYTSRYVCGWGTECVWVKAKRLSTAKPLPSKDYLPKRRKRWVAPYIDDMGLSGCSAMICKK